MFNVSTRKLHKTISSGSKLSKAGSQKPCKTSLKPKLRRVKLKLEEKSFRKSVNLKEHYKTNNRQSKHERKSEAPRK